MVKNNTEKNWMAHCEDILTEDRLSRCNGSDDTFRIDLFFNI